MTNAVSIDDPRLRDVPPEMRGGLVSVIADEPDHTPAPVTFDRTPPRRGRFDLRQLLRPSRGALAVAIALVAIETVAAHAGPLLIQRAIDHGIVPREFRPIVVAAVLFGAAIFVGYGVTVTRIWWTGRLGQDLTKRLRVRLFTHLQRLSQSYFTEERIGRLLTRMTSDVEALTQLLQDGIVNLIVQAFTLVFVAVVLFTLNVRLALIVLLGIVPVMTALTWWFRGASERTYRDVRDRIAELLADLQENLAGARVITATNRTGYNEVTHRELVGRHQDAMISAGNVSGIYTPLVQTIGVLGQILVIAIGGQEVLAGELQIGELIAFVLYLGAFFAPIQELTNLYNTYQSGQAAVRKLADLLDDEPSVLERAGASELHIDRGSVTFEHVTFGYREDTPVVDEIDLHIEPGESIALVGETGAGKSTLSKLITRTYDPQHGRILVDGQDVAAVTITSLRAAIGVVPQEPFLFSGSLRHNLTIGRPDAPDDDVLDICRAVGLGRLLARLGGLDGELAERGVGLSAGERQLVALARALVPGPHLLVLDEATSNLDLLSERQVEHALDVALEGRTAILIVHRLSTAERADRVIVMKDGRIVEVGHHDELVAAGGHYANMHATWVTSAA